METIRLPANHEYNSSLSPSLNPLASIEKSLSSIFPQQQEENKVLRTRKLLGETAASLSNEQIETMITEFQYLIDVWLDDFEREILDGMTLKEVLGGKKHGIDK